ncbi:hypothetical protein [Rhizorhapis suberifaciens]|uniref:Uncharacterized protein n=1 Tax=Rhizorhapis suberifaciens TaxID=13656 RepID=A0A840HVR6_9SPHN|nr:hypothetical protein [Rhizorhapis suberifaciens]MBB4641628.1 hypothetical protein [Rhizorhapis suberifaciens]
MRNILKAIMGVVILFSVTPAQAASCWNIQAIEAAQVRDFETMLMVSALRCRNTGVNFLDEYNDFVRSKRTALTQVNDELRAQFEQTLGAKAALNAYDGYVTSLANSYGAGAVGLACSDMQSLTRAANAASPSKAALVTLAQRAGADPRLPGAKCPLTIAAK